MPPEFRRLLKEDAESKLDLLTRVFDAGFAAGERAGQKIGEAKERARVAKLLGVATSLATANAARVHRDLAPKNIAVGYGEITRMVQSALREIGTQKEGVDAAAVTEYIHQWPSGLAIDIGQVRTALKVMTKNQEAKRVTRGRYVIGPNMPKEAQATLTLTGFDATLAEAKT